LHRVDGTPPRRSGHRCLELRRLVTPDLALPEAANDSMREDRALEEAWAGAELAVGQV